MKFLFAAILAGQGLMHAGVIKSCSVGVSQCGGSLSNSSGVSGNSILVNMFTNLGSTVPGTGFFTYDQAYITDGPVRPGFMMLTMAVSGDATIGSGNGLGSVSFAGFGCTRGAFTLNGACYLGSIQPVTLGQVLTLHMESSLSRAGSGLLAGAHLNNDLWAVFYENDGGALGAAVNVTPTPEPGTMALMGTAALVIGLWGRRRRERSL